MTRDIEASFLPLDVAAVRAALFELLATGKIIAPDLDCTARVEDDVQAASPMRRPSADALDMSIWPGIDLSALKPEARQRYRRRVAAIEHYGRGLSLDDIRAKTQIDRRVLYRMIERALRTHPDGRVWGFRALIPGLHTKAYERRKPAVAISYSCPILQ